MIDFSFFDKIHDRRASGCIKYSPAPTGSREPVIPMWIADMDFKSPPAVYDAVLKAAEHGIYGYGDTGELYNRLVSDWYRKRMNWQIREEEILNVPTVLFGVAAAIRAITKPGDSILICQPVYHPFAQIIENNNCKAVVSELVLRNGHYEMDLEDLKNKITENNVRVFLFCSPHNPVGRVWTEKELCEIGRICEENDVYIISDEIHSDFVYTDYPHIPIGSVSDKVSARTVTCISPTKTFNMAGLKAANVVITDENLRNRVRRECVAVGHGEINIMGIAAAKAAYEYGEQWLDTLVEYLRQNIAVLKSGFTEDAPISLVDMEGTYLAWLDCRKLGMDCDRLYEMFLKKAGVWLHKGTVFGQGGQGFMRMNIACPRAVLEEAVERINRCI